jgi:hypothetical protein
MENERIQLTLSERREASVARALRLTGRPDSSAEYVQQKPKVAVVAAKDHAT